MVARPLLPVTLAFLVALAGCSGGGKPDVSAVEQAARDLDVEATDSTGIIRGVVVDAAIAPVAGVRIALSPTARNVTTNDVGAFAFDGLEPGTYFLSTSHANYTSVQQSTDVVAGDQDPPIVRIQVMAIPRGAPYISATQHSLFMDSSTAVAGATLTLGGFTGQGSFGLGVELDANATVVQAEFRWDPTSPAAGEFNVYGGTYDADDERVHYRSISSGSPLVGRWNATDGNQTATVLSAVIRVAPTELNVAYNQAVDVYVHAFYNFMPRDDWQFGRDGEYPVPPS